VVGAIRQQHRLVDADGRGAVGDAVVDDIRSARQRHLGGREHPRAAAGRAGRGAWRPGGPQVVDPRHAAADAACGSRARRAVAGRRAHPGDPAGAAVHDRLRHRGERADVADASAGAGACRESIGRDRAGVRQPEPRARNRPRPRRSAARRDERGSALCGQRGVVRSRAGSSGSHRDPQTKGHASGRACAGRRPRRRTLRREFPHAAGADRSRDGVHPSRRSDLGAATAGGSPQAGASARSATACCSAASGLALLAPRPSGRRCASE
jgi:hypothetical protein